MKLHLHFSTFSIYCLCVIVLIGIPVIIHKNDIFVVISSIQEKSDVQQTAGSHVANNDLFSNNITSRPKPILFLHLSKCGGISVCDTMKESDLPITNMKGEIDENRHACNVQFKYGLEWGWIPPRHCVDLIPFTTDAEGRPYQRENFLAIESPWYDEMPCPGFRTFSFVRHPVDRYISLIFFLRKIQPGENMGELDLPSIMKYLRGEEKVPDDDGTPPWLELLFEHNYLNSWTIRQLLGYHRLEDQRPVDDKDLERAKMLVDRFDAFVPLEHLSHSNVQKLLNETVPEYYNAWVKTKDLHSNSIPHAPVVDEDFLRLVTEQNKYDILLYEYVLEKHGISVNKSENV